jgi:hypothetical protein
MVCAATIPNHLLIVQVRKRRSDTTCIASDLFDVDVASSSDPIFDRTLLHRLQMEMQASGILLCFVKLQDEWACRFLPFDQLVELHFVLQGPQSIIFRLVTACLFHNFDELRRGMAIFEDIPAFRKFLHFPVIVLEGLLIICICQRLTES